MGRASTLRRLFHDKLVDMQKTALSYLSHAADHGSSTRIAGQRRNLGAHTEPDSNLKSRIGPEIGAEQVPDFVSFPTRTVARRWGCVQVQ